MLGTKKPREQNGRDTFARYKAQVRSAAIASLAILEGEVDRVYCDLHDDYVVRFKKNGSYQYSFYQVKTNDKSNYRWTINDLFGINPRRKLPADVSAMKDSYGGKMFLHTLNFPDNCKEIIFQTNITLNDTAEKFIESIIKGNFESKHPKTLFDNFREMVGDTNDTLTEKDIVSSCSRFKVIPDVQYLKNKDHRFESYAIDNIHKYSEIELSRKESEIILLKLVDLVSDKSSGILSEYNEETIENEAAIGLDDLLNVLSISKPAYDYLVNSGDENAIKSTSIIQKSLNSSEADTEQLMYCIRCKVAWDVWWSKNRHPIPDYKLISIRDRVNKSLRRVVSMNIVDFSKMISSLEDLYSELESSKLLYDLTMDELIGAFFSELGKELE